MATKSITDFAQTPLVVGAATAAYKAGVSKSSLPNSIGWGLVTGLATAAVHKVAGTSYYKKHGIKDII